MSANDTGNFEVEVAEAKFGRDRKEYDLMIRRESHGWVAGELTMSQLIIIRNKLTEFIDDRMRELLGEG